MAELAVGHISIVADTSKLPGQIKKSLNGVSGYGSDVGSSIGSKISSGIGKTLKAGVAGVGVAAGGALAGSITKGLGRLTGIETAQAKLKGLGNDAEDVESIMDNALASVKGTSFGLGEAATTAAGAVAAGIKPGKELEGVLKSVANSASATGSDMDEMGGIFNKVASVGKAQNDVLAQVADRGLPIYQALADQLGVTTDEVFKMASAGEIGFAEFEAAMTQAAGTVAEELGGTTVGTLQNVGSAMGRFGESLLAPAFSAAPALFGSVITVFDELTDAVKPVSEEMGEKLTPALEGFADIIETRVAPFAGEAVGKIGDIVLAITDKALNPDTWEKFGDIFTTIKDVAAELWPSIESLAGSFLKVTQNVSVATWQILASTLDAIAPLIESVLVPLVEKVAEFAENNPGVVEKMVMAFLGFKAVGAISGPVSTAASTLGTLNGAVKGVSGAFKGASIGQGLLSIMGGAKSANPVLAKLGGVVGTVFQAFWKVMPVLSKVGNLFMTGIRFINPWVGALTLVSGALTYFFAKTESGQKIWQSLVDVVTGALDWIREKFGEFTGWITDAWNGLKALFLEGDFTSALRDAFGWEEDNAFVNGILTIRDAFTGLRDLVVDGNFGEELRNVFGWEEDHPMVAGILTIRDVTINTFDTIKENVSLAVDAIKNSFSAVWSLLTGDIEGFKDSAGAALDSVKEIFSNAWSTIRENASLVFSTIWDSLGINPEGALGRTLSGVWDVFSNAFETVRLNLADWASAGLDVLKGIFAFTSGDFDGFKEHFGNAFESVKDIASRAWETVKENASTMWETVQFAAPRAWDGITEHASSAWDSISSTVSSKADEMWSGIKSGAKSAFDWASDNEITGPAVGVIASIGEGIGSQWGVFNEKIQPIKDAASDLWGVLTGNGEESEEGEKRGGIAGLIDNFTGQLSDLQDKFEPVKNAASDLWGVLTGKTEEYVSDGKSGIAGMLSTFTENVSNLKEKMQPGIDAIKGVWNALTGRDENGEMAPADEEQGGIAGMVQTITDKLTELRANVQPVIDEFKDKWNQLKDAVQPHLEKVSEVLGDVAMKIGGATLVVALGLLLSPFIILAGAIYGAVVALNGIADAFSWVSEKWTQMKEDLQLGWAQIKEFVIDAFTIAWTNLQTNFQLIMDALNTSWTWLKDMLVSVWNTIRDTVINAFQNALEGLRGFFQVIVDNISGLWSSFKDHLHNVWVWVKENVFDAIGRGLDQVKGWFQSAVDAIRDIWNGIKSAAAKPVKFVVETVYNNGIRKAWNAVANFVGLDDLTPVALGDLGKYAKGGVLPGYTPGRDPYNFVDPSTGTRVALSGGEAIMRPEWTRAIGAKSVHAMNNAAVKGGVNGVRRMLGGDSGGFVKAYAKGGIYENGDTKRKEEVSGRVVAAQDFVRREHGKPYQWGGVGNPSWDCSGLWSGIVQVINGGNGFGGRLFNTNSFMANPGAFGFSRGLHGPVTVGVSTDHMAGTLGGINAESASMPKGVQLGGSAWGSDNSYFPNQYTMDAILGEFISGGAGGGGGFNLGAMVKSIWDNIIDNIGSWGGPGLIGKLPGAMLKTLAESAWNFIKERVGSFFGRGGEGGNRESWREMAMAAMRRNGFNADDPRQVDAMLDQIMSESGGIADRNQEIVDMNGTGANAGQGLLQIIPGTFAAHRDPELPNDRTDAWANMNAALRYYRATYGDDLTTMWGHGHGYARGGVLPGFTPGRDVHNFVSPTGGALRLSGGEAIMRPEWTRAVGGAGAVNSMNRAATSGNAGVLPGLAKLPKSIRELQESMDVVSKEFSVAYHGGDWGYGELSRYIGDEFAHGMLNGVASLGEAVRNGDVDIAGLQEQGRKSAEDYAAEQASGLLSTFGLEGLVPLAQKAGAQAWENYQASPYDVGLNGQTIVVEYVGDENDREWKMLQKLDKEVALLKAKRKPKASAMTRGGVQ